MTTLVITFTSGLPAEMVAQFARKAIEQLASNVQIEITEGLSHQSPEKPVGAR